MIVVEGGDLAGKSTLVSYLAERLGWPTAHIGLPKPPRRHWDDVRDALLDRPLNTIYDRMCVGSYVYGQIMHDLPNAQPVVEDEMFAWGRVLSDTRSLLIWARTSRHDIIERYKAKGDPYVSLDQILTAHELYESAIPKLLAARQTVNGRRYTFMIYNSSQEPAAGFCKRNELRLSAGAFTVGKATLRETLEEAWTTA